MGLPTEGFEGEIVNLMTGVSEKRYKDKGKGVQGYTKYDRELKRLSWTINEKGSFRAITTGNRARESFEVFE